MYTVVWKSFTEISLWCRVSVPQHHQVTSVYSCFRPFVASQSPPWRPTCQKAAELSFPQKTTSSSGREAPWSSPLHSPLSKTGSVHSSRDGSRTWSVLRDLRRTRNAITVWKLVLPIHASTYLSDIISTLLQSLVTGRNWNWIQSLKFF